MNTLQRLHAEQDQSPWVDFIDRDLIAPLFTEPFSSRWLFDLELLMRFRQLVGEDEFERSVIEVPLRRWVDQGSSRIRPRDMVAVPYGLLRIRQRYRS